MHNEIIFSLSWIFCGAAILATAALYTHQSLLVTYIVLGVLLGPSGIKLISDPVVLKDVGDIGIIFLLFLLGLSLEPQNLIKTLRETTVVTLLSSAIFACVGYSIAWVFGFKQIDALLIGVCMMFSSTIIGLKLLPTTVLHHQRIGEIVISILLLQDIIAILALLILHGAVKSEGVQVWDLLSVGLALPALILFAFLAERYILIKIIQRFNRIHEYLFLVAIGWCLGLGQLAEMMQLSFEVGAFIAGISIAQSPIARFIAESLRPIRDFFLILFFFSLGAKLNLNSLNHVWISAVCLAAVMLLLKPFVLQFLLSRIASSKAAAWEVGVRIGQISEFSLLVCYTAQRNNVISQSAYSMIQLSTIITFLLSSYWVVNHYPTPIATSERLRRD